MTTSSGDPRDRLARVDDLVRVLEELPDTAAREAARQLVLTLLELHAAGMKRVLELSASVESFRDRLARDRPIECLLLLHGLHPHSAAERAERALARARSRFHAIGGDVLLVAATEEAVHLRLRGEASAGAALRAASEHALMDVLPDLSTLEFEEAWEPPGRISLPMAADAWHQPMQIGNVFPKGEPRSDDP